MIYTLLSRFVRGTFDVLNSMMNKGNFYRRAYIFVAWKLRLVLEWYYQRLLQKTTIWEPLVRYWTSYNAAFPGREIVKTYYGKQYLLYQAIRTRKPQYVLECGSGASTLIIGHALKENGSGQLISIDENVEYSRKIMEIVGSEYPISTHIETIVSDSFEGVIGCRYAKIPDHAYDFVFVDGPTTPTTDLDAWYVLEKNPHAFVMIDNRTSTYHALRTRYAGYFVPLIHLGFIYRK